MGRRRKQNKLPTTSIAITDELHTSLLRHKSKRDSIGDFLQKIVSEWLAYREEYPFVLDAYNKSSNKTEEYAQQIQQLQSRLNNMSPGLGNIEMVEPTRGVAAIPSGNQNQSTTTTTPISRFDNIGGEFKRVEQW